MHVKLKEKKIRMKMKLHLLSHCNLTLTPFELLQTNSMIVINLDKAVLELFTK